MIRTGSKRKLWRNNLALFISLLVLIFAMPVIPIEDLTLTRIILGLIVVSGLFAAEFNKQVFRILFASGAMVILLTLLGFIISSSRILDTLAFFANTLFFIAVTLALVAQVAQAKSADGSTILAAINSYLLIGLTASLLLLILNLFAPQSFNQVDPDAATFSNFLYFGFVTLTTLGYGDITPATPLARSMSTFFALFGQLYLVIIMAMIIGKYLHTTGEDNNGKGEHR
jgi:hypothetical protein